MTANRYRGPPDAPWREPAFNEQIVHAIRALAAGKASETQQLIAWKWILYVTATKELEFRPGGRAAERNSAFASGKRFVAIQLEKLLHPELKFADEQKSAVRQPRRNYK